MKLSILLLFFAITQVNAEKVFSQTITASFEKAELRTVLNAIEKKGKVRFIYNYDLSLLSRKVDFSVKNASITEALNKLLDNSGLQYRQMGSNLIVISPGYPTDPEPPTRATVTGVVTDNNSQPLMGVSVSVKASTLGTVTDENGRYTLNIPSGNAVLLFSIVGFAPQEQALSGKSVLNVTLTAISINLNEVVVVGYGTQKKASVTGAIASVPMNEISDMPVANVATALQGKISGVVIQQNSGSPGRTPAIKVRGFGSISAGTGPLIVVDGNIVPASVFGLLDAEEIDKIDVLKDASSAAIYGSRGANGVILVTTKKGVSGKPRLGLNMYTGFQQVTNKIPLMNSQEFAAFAKEAANNAYLDNVPGASVDDPNSVRPSNYLRYRYPRGDLFDWFNFDDPAKVAALPYYDFQDLIFRTAPISNYQFSASGGSDNVRYAVSAGYLTQKGIIKRSAMDRYTLRANVDLKAAPKLTIGMNINPSYRITDEVRSDGHWSENGIINAALTAMPLAPIYNENGGYSSQTALAALYNYPGITNPVANITEYNSKFHQLNLLSSAYAEYQFLPNLKYRVSGNAIIYSNRRNVFTTSKMPLNQQLPPTAATGYAFTEQSLSWLVNQVLTYKTSLWKHHNLEVLAGMESNKLQYQSSQGNGGTFANDIVQTLNAAGQPLSVTSQITENATVSYFARIDYNYKTKYLLKLSVRRDGSSIFGPDKRFGTFPAASIGWRLTEEPFLYALPAVSELKLRASYGLSGNNSFNNYYPYVGGVGSTNYAFSDNLVTGLAMNSLGNTGLSWERNQQLDLGMDIGLFKNRLTITVDYYDRITRDLLLSVNVPTLTGFGSAFKNMGKMNNKGFEFGVSSYNLTGAFTWNTSANLSFNRNKVLALGPTGDPILSGSGVGETNKTMIGEPIGSFFGYKAIGVFRDAADLAAHPHDNTSRPGDVKYADVNGDKVLDAKDRTIIGNNQPDFIYGINNSFSYKNIDLAVSLQGTQGGQILNLSRRFFNNQEGGGNNLAIVLDRWRSPENPGNGTEPRANARTTGNNNAVSSRWVEDGSYLRIQNISLGYKLSKAAANRLGLQSLRFYASAQNLHTWSNYMNYNPEVSNYEGPLTGGVDYGSYPLAKTVTFGINIGF
ncbi:MAG: SusC/RagA family TonB-linked outer membrane protein [Candidatus Pseudobacter hemicellulosilyticus]|uniref:SusC/RagA family TonB-linked outer membrane protein n=1 Tax=Candidatus Pseudobacter hemicellulosilyticus TaxID=3121375 RepID=A0AAJ5WPV2_9BACT|nr:MAG: SusC/RagA family TonB-linked outer membrane protein [Pseudobacter sp.]